MTLSVTSRLNFGSLDRSIRDRRIRYDSSSSIAWSSAGSSLGQVTMQSPSGLTVSSCGNLCGPHSPRNVPSAAGVSACHISSHPGRRIRWLLRHLRITAPIRAGASRRVATVATRTWAWYLAGGGCARRSVAGLAVRHLKRAVTPQRHWPSSRRRSHDHRAPQASLPRLTGGPGPVLSEYKVRAKATRLVNGTLVRNESRPPVLVTGGAGLPSRRLMRAPLEAGADYQQNATAVSPPARARRLQCVATFGPAAGRTAGWPECAHAVLRQSPASMTNP